jgi:prepilin-type N-terminal cleavage/methylation domain-containing protein
MSEHAARARTHGGVGRFTVIELLIAIVVVGILLAIAVPAYVGLRERAWDREARANVTAAVPAVDAYVEEHGAYTGMTLAALREIDPAVELDADPTVTRTTYCIESTVHGQTWKIDGPGATGPVPGTCS